MHFSISVDHIDSAGTPAYTAWYRPMQLSRAKVRSRPVSDDLELQDGTCELIREPVAGPAH